MKTDIVTPEVTELGNRLERIRLDLDRLDKELEQALSVWRSTLVTEKKSFQSLWQTQTASLRQDEAKAQSERQALEQQIQDLDARFQERLSAAEEAAKRTMQELDAAWLQQLMEKERIWTSEKESKEQHIVSLAEQVQAQNEQRNQWVKLSLKSIEAQVAAINDILYDAVERLTQRKS